MIGILITTVGILLLVLGLVGASIEVYGRLLSATIQQQVSGAIQQLPAILRPEESAGAEETGPPFNSTDILGSLVENLISTPLWLVLAVVGIVLIYLGLYLAQRQRSGYQP